MKKVLLVLCALLVSGTFLFAGGAAEKSDVTEIHMWFGRQDFIPGDAFDAFHKENPNIRVTTDVIPLEQSLTEFISAYQANRAPDLFQTNVWNTVILQRQNMVMDISNILEEWKNEDSANFNGLSPAAWNLAAHNGTPYGMALHVMPYLYVYRSDVLEEFGLSVPRTWDDVIEVGKAVSRHGYLGFSLNASRAQNPAWYQSKLMAMGGQYPDGIPVLDDEAGRYSLRVYQRMIAEGVAHFDSLSWDTGDMRAAFIRGEAVQALIGINIFPTIERELTYGSEWGFTAPPYRPGAEAERQVMANAWPYLVNAKSSEKADAIKKVLQYLSRHEIVKEVAMRYQPTTRMSVAADPEYLAVQPWFEDLQEIYAVQVPIPAHIRTTEVNEVLKDAMHEALAYPNRNVRQITEKYEAELQKFRGGN